MRVKQLADDLGVAPDTIRYYTRIGLLKPARLSSGYHDYGDQERRFLRFVIRAKQLGFSLSDVKEIMELAGTGESPCPRVRELMRRNMAATDRSFREVRALRRRMRKALQSWDTMADAQPTGESVCTLIEDWDNEVG
jgi:DNA-binding transcriptional MerR regulator